MNLEEFNEMKRQMIKDVEEMDTFFKFDIRQRDYVSQEMFKALQELYDNLITNKYIALKIKSMEYVTEALVKFNKDSKSQILSIYKNSRDYFEDKGIDFYGLIYEKIYIDSYQYFEWYISSLFQKLYTAFPAFLLDYKDKRYNNVSIELSDEVNKHIEKKTQILMHNNIYEIIDKFKNIFGIDIINIKEEDKKELFTISQNRNLLVHNNGVVNNTYLNKLKQREIISRYSLDDIIKIKKNEEIEVENKVIYDVSKGLTDVLINSWDDVVHKYIQRIK